ncbi:MAG: hypothetical protein F6K42_19030 [Leptolyngbya sp. SIO1D8]|nr:hypothetical protein [Leptolyngbya sp. SIO1D8]
MKRSGSHLNYLSFILIAFGITARLAHYFSNRSLWLDETSLALNILNRSYGELLGSLDYNQAAPPFFLWAEKLVTQYFGASELSLRFLPLMAGILSIFLFYQFAHQFSKGLTIPIAIALFSSLESTIFYSAELKPYAVDLTVSLLLFRHLALLSDKKLSLRQNLSLGCLGMICIWLSYPSIFVLGGVEILRFFPISLKKISSIWRDRYLMYCLWIIGFLTLYFFVIQTTLSGTNLTENWANRYPESFLDIVWAFDAFGRFFHEPLGFPSWIDGIAIFAFFCGCICFYRRDKPSLRQLNMPLALTLLASYFHQYPFRDRLVYFLTPFAILMIAEGITFLLFGFHQKGRFSKIIGFAVLITLLSPQIVHSSQRIANPKRFHFEHIRPVIEHIQENWSSGDHLFVFPPAKRQFSYYQLIHPFYSQDYSIGQYDIPKEEYLEQFPTSVEEAVRQSVVQLKSQERVWFLFARRSEFVQDQVIASLDQKGLSIEVYQQPGAMVGLYTFKE